MCKSELRKKEGRDKLQFTGKSISVNHLFKIEVKNALAKMKENRVGPNDIYGYLGVHGQNWLDWLIKLFK